MKIKIGETIKGLIPSMSRNVFTELFVSKERERMCDVKEENKLLYITYFYIFNIVEK